MKKADFINFLKEKEPSYILIENDKDNNHFKIQHLICGNIYTTNVYCFINLGRRCPKCNGGVKYTHDEFIEKLKNMYDDEYEVLEKYINSTTEILFRHSKCGKNFLKKPVAMLQGFGCTHCSKTKRKTTTTFNDEVKLLTDGEFYFIGDYKNNKTKIEFIHNIETCKHHFFMRPHDFLKGCRCPKCKQSVGEKVIEDFLVSKNIKYIYHYKDTNCKNKKVLEFDFKIYLNDNSFILLEYDGKLHFEPWDNTEKSLTHLKEQRINDKIKNNFCEKNNIRLERISYKEDINSRLVEILGNGNN